jgi:hypothetical protein
MYDLFVHRANVGENLSIQSTCVVFGFFFFACHPDQDEYP